MSDDDPTTDVDPDTVTLADRLDDWADWDPDEATIAPDLRAAAQLRQLDRIKAAADDDLGWSVALAVCRELAVRYPSWANDLNLTEALLRRISDALEADDGA